jgi:hypothetical protein
MKALLSRVYGEMRRHDQSFDLALAEFGRVLGRHDFLP